MTQNARVPLVLIAFVCMFMAVSIHAENGVQFSDVSISLGDSRKAVTEKVLASKNHYSLRGGDDELLTILNPHGALTAIVRFRDDFAVGIETVWTADTAI